MVKPRHHTLQGICQDVCVNYQQVVEVHRRIRDVVLKENGKVITHNLGTFFCRDQSPRSGVLNGQAWSTEGFFEVGLKGERAERSGSHNEPTATRTTVRLFTQGLGDSVLSDLLDTFPGYESIDFREDGTIIGQENFDRRQVRLDMRDVIETNTVSAEGLSVGFHDVNFSIEPDENQFAVQLGIIVPGVPLLQFNEGSIGLGESVTVDITDPVEIVIHPDYLQNPSRRGFGYRMSFTLVQNESDV